jgi:hypothetical protein
MTDHNTEYDTVGDLVDSPLTEQDEADLDLLNDGDSGKLNHTLLEMWRSILGNVEAVSAQKVTPAIANRIVNAWPKLSFADVADYHATYHAFLLELRDILDEVIASDPKCLTRTGEDEDSDAVANRGLYIELLFRWQERIMLWDAAWDCTSPQAGVLLAAIADATSFSVGSNGLVAHLDQIRLDFTDADRAAMGARLEAAKAEL